MPDAFCPSGGPPGVLNALVAWRALSVGAVVCSLVPPAALAQEVSPTRSYEPPTVAALSLTEV
ncbi:MAG: hypothetical protein JSW71_05360, partial [Gemmatimonadota bacterium]